MGNDENTWREEGMPKIRSSCILCTTAKHPKLLVIVPSPNQRAELRRSNAKATIGLHQEWCKLKSNLGGDALNQEWCKCKFISLTLLIPRQR
jgi:hypothetical protein